MFPEFHYVRKKGLSTLCIHLTISVGQTRHTLNGAEGVVLVQMARIQGHDATEKADSQ